MQFSLLCYSFMCLFIGTNFFLFYRLCTQLLLVRHMFWTLKHLTGNMLLTL